MDVNLARFSSHVFHIFEYISIVSEDVKDRSPRHSR